MTEEHYGEYAAARQRRRAHRRRGAGREELWGDGADYEWGVRGVGRRLR